MQISRNLVTGENLARRGSILSGMVGYDWRDHQNFITSGRSYKKMVGSRRDPGGECRKYRQAEVMHEDYGKYVFVVSSWKMDCSSVSYGWRVSDFFLCHAVCTNGR